MRRLVSAVLACVAISGCGGGGPDDSGKRDPAASRAVAATAKATRSAGRARFEMRSDSQPAGDLDFTIEGDSELASKRVHGVIAFQGGDQKGKRVELVFAGDQRFVRQVGTRQWIKAPPQESATQSTDLESSLRYLGGVTDDVQRLGSERVRGVSTVRYSATVDLDKVADSLPDDERDAYRKQTQQLQTKTLPVELWIDDAHRLRRLTYGLDLKRLGVSEPGLERLDFTAELYDFGEPAPIRVPTAVGG